MVLLFFNSVLLIVSLIYLILCLKAKDNFGLAMAVSIILSSTFIFGAITREYTITNKLVKEEVVERVYDSQTGEPQYIIKDGVIGFDKSFKKLEIEKEE